MNDSNQYMVQVGDYDQNTYIIQDANGVPVQYDGNAIISGDIAEGNNMITEPRWIQQNSARGGKIMSSQAFVNGDLVSVNGTGLNLNTRFTPSSIVLNSTSGAQFDQDSLRLASAVTGTGGRGRPRGRKPSRGNFPVVPIDMVRQLGIEQQVILQPTVPVATKNKAIQTSTIQMAKKTQCNDIGINDMAMGNIESNMKYMHVPVFIPIPVPIYIPVPTFIREKPIPVNTSIQQSVEHAEQIIEEIDVPKVSPQITKETDFAVSQDKQITLPNEDSGDNKPHVEATVDDAVTSDSTITVIENNNNTNSKKRHNPDSDYLMSTPNKTRKLDSNPEPVRVQDKKDTFEAYKLKYSYGINAWRHWSKNIDLLKLSPCEINKHMVEFIQKIRKPNAQLYGPDSIFYLCLGIQLFLLEHKNSFNMFMDSQFVEFQNQLNKILATFIPKLAENHVLVCRIEENHLWETQQLGTHSPAVLLFSVCYLITRQMKVKSVEEHALLSIDQLEVTDTSIMFVSNTDNHRYTLCEPSGKDRCFYEIVRTYLVKCQETGERRSRCLYLRPSFKLPELLDVWYEPEACESSLLDMMLNRIRMVREVQESLLTLT